MLLVITYKRYFRNYYLCTEKTVLLKYLKILSIYKYRFENNFVEPK